MTILVHLWILSHDRMYLYCLLVANYFHSRALAKVNKLACDHEWLRANMISAEDMTPSIRFIFANELVSDQWCETSPLSQQVVNVVKLLERSVHAPIPSRSALQNIQGVLASSPAALQIPAATTLSPRRLLRAWSLEASKKFNDAMCGLFTELETASGDKKAFLENEAQFDRDFL